jgi:ubiquinone/menaquinone biosynthesis C-methylase UbiE
LTHKFDAKNKKRLDTEERRAVMPPHKTLERFGLREGNTVADIGCGTGYFTIPAAEIAGAAANVFAMDISMEMLEEVEKKALEAGITNIREIRTDEYDLKVDNLSADFIIVSNVLHEIKDKSKFISEINRIQKIGGILAIIEWEKRQGEPGPPVEEGLSYEDLSIILSQNEYKINERHCIGAYFYGITARKG